MRRAAVALVAVACAAGLLAACGGGGGRGAATTTTISTKPANRQVEACQLRAAAAVPNPKRITIAAATPAYEPWFLGNDPANGLGYEAGLGYQLAARLGFPAKAVRWSALPFAALVAKGKRPFDLALSEVPGDVVHARSVRLSRPYWPNPQALVALEGSPLARLAPLRRGEASSPTAPEPLATARLGVVARSSSARYVRDAIQPAATSRYGDLDAAASALLGGKVDGVVAALPDAWLMARNARRITLVGRFGASGQGFVVVVPRGGIPVACVNQAIASLRADGSTPRLSRRYLRAYQAAELLWTAPR